VKDGMNVGIIDANLQSPSLHILFDPVKDRTFTFRDVLEGNCGIEEVAQEIFLDQSASPKGKLYLIPGNTNFTGGHQNWPGNTLNLDDLSALLEMLQKRFGLKFLIIDTQSGLNEETLVFLSAADILGLILRPDQRDYQGTAVTVELASKLGVPKVRLIVNQVPKGYDLDDVKTQVERTYQCKPASVIPYAETLAGQNFFTWQTFDHRLADSMNQTLKNLLS
jgi:MinD-like ATPase involved in chromosome partitioning or flagellar assembly